MKPRVRTLDIQTKIILVLIGVIVPTFLVVTLVQNQVTQPILEQEMKHIGIATAETLSSKILSHKWLSRPQYYPEIEGELQELIYLQPSILRLDVWAKDPAAIGEVWRVIASNVEGETGSLVTSLPSLDVVTSTYKTEEGMVYWDISVPIEATSSSKGTKKTLGVVHLLISTRTATRLNAIFWRISVAAAIASTLILIIVLSFFLRRAVKNERLLRRVESRNIQLSQQLHEAQRELMNVEKLAVMGQLTANFAHEIGTPLNAISGHLQLLKEETQSTSLPERSQERMDILNDQVVRIEKIVKGFLQTAAKPDSQKQLSDLNKLVQRSLELVRPRLEVLGVRVTTDLDTGIGPMRIVPTDLEQIIINLLNNSLDSIELKKQKEPESDLVLSLRSEVKREEGKDWVRISIHDNGMGISHDDLKNVMKPFFTTKQPGKGTGLGLAICRQLAGKYGGLLRIDSKEGAWAEADLRIPYGENV